ncbi:MAG: sulfite exporter TauE/SafE family protein [Candidatus Omnitrophica bacterium]|nr:sulfite exporter TauE/SafE family protein [Candidatus Omnitrophota bacterium]
MSFEWLFLVSVISGFIGAMSGVGGGVVLIPVMTLSGIDIKQAIAVSSISILAVSCSAAPSYVRRHMPSLNTSAFLEVFAVVGAFIGALINLVSGRRLLFFLCGGILFLSSVLLWKRQDEEGARLTGQEKFSRWLELEGSYYDDAESRTIAYRGNHAFLAGALMFGTGLTTGLLGIGGSALTVLILEEVMGLPTKVSLTTSNLIIGVMALAGANVYLEVGLLNLQWVVPVILGVPLGAFVGSKLLVQLRNQIARLVLISVLIIWGIEIILHGMRGIL